MGKHGHKLEGWQGVPFNKVNIEDSFWRPRLEVLKTITMRACLDQCERTGRIANFAKAGGLVDGSHEGRYYNDSDVYKVLEGAAYSLMIDRDPSLEIEIDHIIDLIAAAQEEDGYLSTYYTLKAPKLKWTDMEKHEMYNGGHLLEAAVAYYEATGKRALLNVACKLADHYDNLFGPQKRHWVEGHEEIELALVKLYRVTGEERYWKLALWLLEERGNGHGVGMIWEKEEWGPAYCQDDVPVRDIETVKGHAVRAMYLFTAMADVVHVSEDPAYVDALHRVWHHTVECNMYVTGGIGPSKHNEGFTHDYDLPNDSAYCETCAAIAMVFWNHRMNLLFGDAKYMDVVERSMLNGALTGISLSGDRFFYVNPLASEGNHHRVEWFDTSCCPTNIVRFLPSIGGYLYAITKQGLAINLYTSGKSSFKLSHGNQVELNMQTEYPWDGAVGIEVQLEKNEAFPISMRIPGWCRSYKASVNGQVIPIADLRIEKGYLVLDRLWKSGDQIEFVMEMAVQVVRSRQEVEANRGRLAIQRGPLVYCLEQEDNKDFNYDDFTIRSDGSFATEYRSDLLGGIVVLSGQDSHGRPCNLIPYYAWDNRNPGFMQVWMREAESPAIYSI